ncbi:MAG: glycosyl hydrolase family 18 protein [Chitinophagales bacterium]
MTQGVIATVLSLALYLSGVTGPSGSPAPSTAYPAGSNAAPAYTEPAPSAPEGQRVTSSLGTTFTIGQRVGLTGTQVNLRVSPDNSSVIAAKASRGTGATLLDAGNGWAKLRLDTGETGWVSDWLVDSHAPVAPAGTTSSGSLKLSPGKVVFGYYTVNFPGDTDSYTSMVANAKRLTGIIPFLFTLDSSGKVTGLHNQAAMAAAKERGLSNIALVHNLSGPWFSSSVIHGALSNPVNRSRAVANIVSLVRTYGYDGVNIDFESVPSYDRSALTAFMGELAQGLHPYGKLVSISVPAKNYDQPGNSWSGAYDYQALGKIVDLMMLMTYDEHFTSGPAGPVASKQWVDSVASYAVSQVSPQKVVLGVPAYGYDWSGYGKAAAVGYDDAMALARRYGRTVQWSSSAGAPYFTYYKNGSTHTVWFESADSLLPKLDIVQRYGLKGIAIWRLGFEDNRIWNVLGQRMAS